MDDSEEYEDNRNEPSEEDVDFAMASEVGGQPDCGGDGIVDDYPFEVLSTEQMVQHMIGCIDEANILYQLPPTTLRILLNHCGWEKHKLEEVYFDGDQQKLFNDAKVVDPSQLQIPPDIPPNGEEECRVCFLNVPSSMMYGLACGHRFCKKCWERYLVTEIMEEGMGHSIPCAAQKCPILVDDASVMTLVTDPGVRLKYQQLISNNFVQCNRLVRWCPAPGCTNAIKVQLVDSKPVTCSCGHTFCFECGENWHAPVNCCMLKKWLKKCQDDSETANWIAVNTKECPKCKATIEKNGGCNHMTCRKCHYHFCWICLGAWDSHGSMWYRCNRYENDDGKTARDAQETSRASLNRYLFYFKRFSNHMHSLKFEHKLYASVKAKMEEMQQNGMSWVEVQFLIKAVDILCQCRQTLMYTYVFAFYLKKTNQSVIFEDNQHDLENATETLSEYLEKDITTENSPGLKQDVQNKYRYCESRRTVLIDHVYEGHEGDLWEYNES